MLNCCRKEFLEMFHQKLSVIFLFLWCCHVSVADSEQDLRSSVAGVSPSPSVDKWTGTWFPHSTTVKPPKQHGMDMRIPMGVRNRDCDDGETRLEVDWDGGAFEYTCYDATKYIPQNIQPILKFDNIPAEYMAPHICMNETIQYDGIPSFGPHRPLWPQYGEYLYVPVQRWLHNLEHGAVVMLYHPCADPVEREKLKDLVRSCLYRHVITPSKLTSQERPFALVAWGKLLTLSMVEPTIVKDFIKTHALKGPEMLSKDGQYTYHLTKHAEVVSTIDDLELCPDLKRP